LVGGCVGCSSCAVKATLQVVTIDILVLVLKAREVREGLQIKPFWK
jgi:heterodisulfide reductase subunit C